MAEVKDVERVNLFTFGVIYILLFSLPLLFSTFYSFMAGGFTGSIPIGLVFTDIFLFLYLIFGIFSVSKAGRNANRMKTSIFLFVIALVQVILYLYGKFISGDGFFVFMLPMAGLSLIVFSIIFIKLISSRLAPLPVTNISSNKMSEGKNGN